MPWPNFLIIGAMKSGTTALYFFLKQHPQVFVSPIKEPNYFIAGGEATFPQIEGARRNISDLDTYLELFNGASEAVAIGEASHSYLYYSQAIERIRADIPDVRLICILRNPAERAYSHFLFHVRDGREQIKDFSQAIREEENRISSGCQFGHYLRRGFYFQQLQKYFAVFPSNQIYVCLYDDLITEPVYLIQKIYQFLGIDSSFTPEVTTRRNPSGIPKNQLIHNLLVKPNPVKSFLQPLLPQRIYRIATTWRDRNLIKPEMPADLKQELIRLYRDDILQLQDLIRRDLSCWLQ